MRVVLLALLVTLGCGKKTREGLPPAQEWTANSPDLAPSAPNEAPAANPHGASPHGDMGGADPSMGNPHGDMDVDPAMAGVPNPHGDMESDPHGATAMSAGPTGDPARRVAGMIKVHPKAKDKLLPNGAIFVMAKLYDENGKPIGKSLAVEKVTWQKDGAAFELSVPPTAPNGAAVNEVVIDARFDQDSDAIGSQVGDVTGHARAKVPTQNIEVTLDTLVTMANGGAPPADLPAGHP